MNNELIYHLCKNKDFINEVKKELPTIKENDYNKIFSFLKKKLDEEKKNYLNIKTNNNFQLLLNYDKYTELNQNKELNENKELYQKYLNNYGKNDLILLNGKINNYKIKILIDTTTNDSIINYSNLNKLGLDKIMDNNINHIIQQSNNYINIIGKIWYLNIKIEFNKNIYLDFPVSLDIIDDLKIKKKKIKIINEYNEKKNFLNNSITRFIFNNDDIKNNKYNFEDIDIILGMSFLKQNNINIDFGKGILKVNDEIEYKY